MFVQLFGVPGVWPGSDASKSLEKLVRAEIPDVLTGEVYVYVHTTGHLSCDDAVVVTVEGAQPAEGELSKLCLVIGGYVFAQEDRFPHKSPGRFERIQQIRVISSDAGVGLSREAWMSQQVLSIDTAQAA